MMCVMLFDIWLDKQPLVAQVSLDRVRSPAVRIRINLHYQADQQLYSQAQRHAVSVKRDMHYQNWTSR